MSVRATPAAAIALIRRFEGYHRRLPDGRAAPYLCPANVWTIGFGATRGVGGAPITPQTKPVSPDEAEALLVRDVRAFEVAVLRLVRVPLTDGQFGALVSFTFNLGAGRLQASTLLRKVNAGLFDQAADEFPKWVMAGGQRLSGLVLRRQAERAMFLAADPRPDLPPAPMPVEAPQPGWLRRFWEAFRSMSHQGT